MSSFDIYGRLVKVVCINSLLWELIISVRFVCDWSGKQKTITPFSWFVSTFVPMSAFKSTRTLTLVCVCSSVVVNELLGVSSHTHTETFLVGLINMNIWYPLLVFLCHGIQHGIYICHVCTPAIHLTYDRAIQSELSVKNESHWPGGHWQDSGRSRGAGRRSGKF